MRPTDLLLENADHLQAKVAFADRMSRITRIWEAASHQNTPLAHLVTNLEKAVLSHNPDFKVIEACAQEISDALKFDGDILPLVEKQLGVVEPQQESLPATQPTQFTHQADFGVEDDTTPLDARLERIKQWRQMAVRGSAGQKFRNEVRNVYDFRCIFSGDRLPKTEATESAGVDAAHILPWSTHNINAVSNGICLNKLCHWALDAGAMKLSFDKASSAYIVEIPDNVRTAAKKVAFDLDYFDKLCGKIPSSRLPKNKTHWPHPKYLDELNNVVFSK